MSGGLAAPGWYRDPAGSPQLRWWDGANWTEHLSAAAPQYQQPQPYAPDQAYAPAQTYAPYTPTPLVRPVLGPNASVHSLFIWLVVSLPLVSAIVSFAWYPTISFETVNGRPFPNYASIYSPGYFLVVFVGLLAYAAIVVFAYLDWRQLGRDGVVRPFHWAFAFIASIVYVIGRSVIVNKVGAKPGLWPIWAAIAVYVIVWIVTIIRVVAIFSSIMSQITPGTFS
jgi:Protein of unknown function (DUF2510)